MKLYHASDVKAPYKEDSFLPLTWFDTDENIHKIRLDPKASNLDLEESYSHTVDAEPNLMDLTKLSFNDEEMGEILDYLINNPTTEDFEEGGALYDFYNKLNDEGYDGVRMNDIHPNGMGDIISVGLTKNAMDKFYNSKKDLQPIIDAVLKRF